MSNCYFFRNHDMIWLIDEVLLEIHSCSLLVCNDSSGKFSKRLIPALTFCAHFLPISWSFRESVHHFSRYKMHFAVIVSSVSKLLLYNIFFTNPSKAFWEIKKNHNLKSGLQCTSALIKIFSGLPPKDIGEACSTFSHVCLQGDLEKVNSDFIT